MAAKCLSPFSTINEPPFPDFHGPYNPAMSTIEIAGLAKSYRVYQKKEGLRAAVRGLFRRQYR